METVWVRPTPACVRFTSALCWPEHQLQISVRGSHRTGCGRPWAGTLSDLDQGQWTTSPPAHAGGSCQFQVGRMVAEVTIRPKWGTVGHDHAHWMARGSGLNQAPGFLLPSPVLRHITFQDSNTGTKECPILLCALVLKRLSFFSTMLYKYQVGLMSQISSSNALYLESICTVCVRNHWSFTVNLPWVVWCLSAAKMMNLMMLHVEKM